MSDKDVRELIAWLVESAFAERETESITVVQTFPYKGEKPSKKWKRAKKKHRKFKRYGGPFFSTPEWRKLRMQALKKYGPKCQCCGATPETGAVMNVDHIKPRKFFPELSLDINNLQILCGSCNHGKLNWDATDWRNPGGTV